MTDPVARELDEDLRLLRPCSFGESSLIARHMDACAAAAMRLGLTAGTVLAIQGAVTERFPSDLVRADHELVRALTQLLGFA
jgi:hypothetical protein